MIYIQCSYLYITSSPFLQTRFAARDFYNSIVIVTCLDLLTSQKWVREISVHSNRGCSHVTVTYGSLTKDTNSYHYSSQTHL